MKGKRVTLFAALIMMALLLSGCGVGWMQYMTRTPQTEWNDSTKTEYEGGDYNVLGIVEAETESSCILGIVIEGQEGKGILWREAMQMYGDKVKNIKDVSVLYEYTGILPPIYAKINTTYYGVAVDK